MNAVTTLKQYANHPDVLSRYIALVNSNRVAQIYISECLLAVANSPELQKCTPQSVITSSLRAVTLGLHLDLDQGYLVPFANQCTFITGYKGMRDLAIRTQKYRILHANHIPGGWSVQFHPITGQASHIRDENAGAGVVAYFEMFDGFAKTVYMTIPEIHAHAAQYSKSYTSPRSPWKASERSRQRMEVKTVFRRLMLEWGYMDPIAHTIIDSEETQEADPTLPAVELTEIQTPTVPRKTREQLIHELTG